MDTQVHNTWPLTCAQHKNFVNIQKLSKIKLQSTEIYPKTVQKLDKS